MLELLLNEKNIAGVWVVIGALLAFLGVISNNFFENRRRKKEREHALIRETYFGGIEYINHYFQKISRISSTNSLENDAEGQSATEKYYKLYLIASPDVIEAFSILFHKNNRLLFNLSLTLFKLQKRLHELEHYKEEVNSSIDFMKKINLDKQEYLDKKLNNQELWALYDQHYYKAEAQLKNAMEKSEQANKSQLELRILLMKECIETMLQISPDIYNAIMSMRSDIDRKLTNSQSKAIKESMDKMMDSFKADVSNFIDSLEKELETLIEKG